MNSYPGHVSAAGFLGGVAALAALVACIVALSYFLAPRIESRPPRPATVELDDAAAGALQCPTPEELDFSGPVPVSSGVLIDCPSVFDGHVVSYSGEVIDAVLRRDDRAWVQLNDDLYSTDGPLPKNHQLRGANSGIAVSIDAAAADRVSYTGGYDAQGDRLLVVGTFHKADPEDGGAPTIRADRTTIAERGHPIPHPVSPRLIVAATMSAAVATALVALGRRRVGDDSREAP